MSQDENRNFDGTQVIISIKDVKGKLNLLVISNPEKFASIDPCLVQYHTEMILLH